MMPKEVFVEVDVPSGAIGTESTQSQTPNQPCDDEAAHAPMPERAAMSQLSFTSFSTMRIADIIVGTRHRRDLGDIDGLAGSIADIGLLHPIVIRRDGMLIAGERRLEACKQLGWVDVPVNVVDIAEIVRAELHENSIRKDFLPSEIDAIRRALEPIEKADAERRMKAGTPAKVSQGSGRVTDKIGSFAGVSGRTVEKIADVVAAAERDPDRYGHLVEEMDKTGKVDRAHKQLKPTRPAGITTEVDPAAADGDLMDLAMAIVTEPMQAMERGEKLNRYHTGLGKFGLLLQKGEKTKITKAFQNLPPDDQQWVIEMAKSMNCDGNLADMVGPLPEPEPLPAAPASREPMFDDGPRLITESTNSVQPPADQTEGDEPQDLAAVPENAESKSNQVSKEALWLQGWLQEFECEDVAKPTILDRDPKDIMATMPPEMLDNVHRLAPRIAKWLNQIGASYENVSGRPS